MSETKDREKNPSGKNSRERETENKENMANKENLGEDNASTVETEKQIENDFEKLQKQLGETEALVGTYKDQLLRLAAEFDNFRKRVEADKTDFVKFSNEKIIKDLIPVLDDFQRALENGKKNSENESFKKGIELIYQKLYKLLEDKGLKPIESVGKEFDVTYHDVLMQVQREDVKPGTIVEEVERGYALNGKIIKHAKVIVASPGQDGTEQEPKN
ncbi:MAG TPA: nucleotide exchange factor GrpE [Candidatus Acidoferrales bacterium]|nr:nucleotide exchange factor GrpE [Candidatus Acidoferrales bacterium]